MRNQHKIEPQEKKLFKGVFIQGIVKNLDVKIGDCIISSYQRAQGFTDIIKPDNRLSELALADAITNHRYKRAIESGTETMRKYPRLVEGIPLHLMKHSQLVLEFDSSDEQPIITEIWQDDPYDEYEKNLLIPVFTQGYPLYRVGNYNWLMISNDICLMKFAT